jgi:hypothetical protein
VADIDPKELTLLASVAYGESYYRQNNFEEMAAIASVMLRQMKCRGYETLKDFTKKEKSFSYVVSDGKPRFKSIKDSNENDVRGEFAAADKKLKDLDEQIALKEKEPGIASGGDKMGGAQLRVLKSKRKGIDFQRNEAEGRDMAYRAARHVMEGGQDYSNGAYFWDGWDIKVYYTTHPKVRVGVHFADPAHNIFDINESTVVVVKSKKVKETKGTKVTYTTVEVGRYDHVYISTAAHGGTVFWKFNPDYVRLEHKTEYR